MSRLSALQKKRTKLIVGLMSGTSADGIDAALINVTGSGPSTRLKQLAFGSYKYPEGFRELLLLNSLPGSGSVDLLCELNVLIAHFFADAVKNVVRKAHLPLSSVDLIGSHGQTVHHLPIAKRAFGTRIRSTLQIGDPSTIAQLTGIVTVGDFRTADMAAGGQGAPLVPYFDYLMFRSKKKSRLLLNIGGIANVTALPKNCTIGDVMAFDTGPGNMIVDALMSRWYGKKFDNGGRTALKGELLPGLLLDLVSHPYFAKKPPKSTGRELFGALFLPRLEKLARTTKREDLLATATELTPFTVFDQYNRFIATRMRPDEVLVSGGGVHNRAMMEALRDYFQPVPVRRV
ncbi:MAG: anhydro-N-acetylmuramic acid kinase, partial [Ignavibacteriales bacterium]|nr:anhydro-N-acetylmuramic acid kinase [Ignavibacteriales bacterium]